MNTIKLDYREYRKLLESGSGYGGSEGALFPYQDEHPVMMKLFHPLLELPWSTHDEILENKRLKITWFLQHPEFPNPIKPYKLVLCRGDFVGYTMTDWRKGERVTRLQDRPIEQRLWYLQKLRRLLERFHEYDVVHGDVRLANALFAREMVAFCDLDNMQIDGIPLDVPSFYADRYMKNMGALDPDFDIFMLNLLAIELITGYRNVYERENLHPKIKQHPLFSSHRRKEIITNTLNFEKDCPVDCLLDELQKERRVLQKRR